MSGLGRTSSKTTGWSRCSSAGSARPAAATPGSVTSIGLMTPSSRSTSPRRASAPAPCTSRVGTSTARMASTSTGIPTPLSGCGCTCERLLPPALGALQIVEREDMEAVDVPARALDALLEPGDERARVEVAFVRQETDRVADADSLGDPAELRARDGARKPDVDRQVRPSFPDGLHPGRGRLRLEADLAHDVGRELPPLQHRLYRR